MLSSTVKYAAAVVALLLLGVLATLQLSRHNTPPVEDCTYHFPSFDRSVDLTKETMDALPAEKKNPPRFELSQCYPQQLSEEQPPWVVGGHALKFWSEAEARDYQLAILRYSYAGNLSVNWVVQRNQPVRWFHAPWLHFGGTGREPLHGLTYELASSPHTLAVKQERFVQNWAVSVYNAPGGFVLGQVWKGVRHPNPDTLPHPEAAVFPNGTVAIKLLFTQAKVDEVAYLRGQAGYEWDAYIYETLPVDPRRPNQSDKRSVQPLRLLQVDISVRDDRSPTGWVFGTFVYNGDLATSPYDWCELKDSPWCKVVPVGMMWGNDPALSAEEPDAGHPPIESIFTDAGMLPTELLKANGMRVGLGRGGRLNGPVDDRKSSCLSCHATAALPQFDRVPPQGLSTEKQMYWFHNFNVRTADGGKQSFWPGTEALDYSLQLSSGLRNFDSCRGAIPAIAECRPSPTPTPNTTPVPAASPSQSPPGGSTFRPQVFRGSDN
jgi:hypothetical protein